MSWRQQLRTQCVAFKTTVIKNAGIGMAIWCFGFLDIVNRYSYHYLGWWSYGIRMIVYLMTLLLLFDVQWELGFIVRGTMGISLIATGLALSIQYQELERTIPGFLGLNYILYLHVQILIVFFTCKICYINNLRRFAAYAYIFLLVGIICNVFSRLFCAPFFFVSICLYMFWLNVYLGAIDRYLETFKQIIRDEIFQTLGSHPLHYFFLHHIMFACYFILMFVVSFIYYIIVFKNDANQNIHSVVFCSLGSCCCTHIAVLGCMSFFICFRQAMLSPVQAIFQSEDTDIKLLMNDTIKFMLFDLCFRDFDVYVRGNQFTQRLSYFLCHTLGCSFILIQNRCTTYDVLHGNLRRTTNIIIIVLYILFIICPIPLADFFMPVYSCKDFWILKATTSLYILSVISFSSLIVFLIVKFDTADEDFSKYFDDIVFYIMFVFGVILIFINILELCCGFLALVMGHYYLEDILRLICLDFNRISALIFKMRFRVKIMVVSARFVENLESTSLQQISKNNYCCPLCLQEMLNAKITPCDHLFHRTCLRKWLLLKQVCPICNIVLF